MLGSIRGSVLRSRNCTPTYGQDISPSSGIMAYLTGPDKLKDDVMRKAVLTATWIMLSHMRQIGINEARESNKK